MDTHDPFAPGHSPKTYFETAAIREALDRLMSALGAREPFLLVTGAPGTGKTALVHAAIGRWGERVAAAFPARPAIAEGELIEEIVRRFGLEPPEGASRSKLMACLEQVIAEIAGRGQVAVVVVDDAHDLTPQQLEELRLLVDSALQGSKPVEVLLAGLPSLEEKLDAPSLAALRQRVSVRARLATFSSADTRHYVHHRVSAAGGDGPALFPKPTCREITALTEGVPRRINMVAMEALRLARGAGQASVTSEHVRAAAESLWGAQASGAMPRPSESPAPTAHVTSAAWASEARTEPPAPAKHDASEWVARFVGDQGPLRLSSRVYREPTSTPEPPKAVAPPTRGPGEVPPREHVPAPEPVQPANGAPTHEETATDLVAEVVASPPPQPLRSHRRRSLPAPVTVSLVAIVAIPVLVMLGRMIATTPHDPSPAALAAKGDAATKAPSASPATHARTTAATAARRDPGEAQPTASAASPQAAAPSPGASPRFTIDVGGYVDLQRAFDERYRIQELTGIEAWVVPAPDGGSGQYRIVLGVFRSAERATIAAGALIANASLHEASVVALPPRRVRM